jgi:hypothetical protein
MTGIRNESNHTRKIAIRVGGFVAKLVDDVYLSSYNFYWGSYSVVCITMDRVVQAELDCAPYDVLREGGQTCVFSIEEMVPQNLHVLHKEKCIYPVVSPFRCLVPSAVWSLPTSLPPSHQLSRSLFVSRGRAPSSGFFQITSRDF